MSKNEVEKYEDTGGVPAYLTGEEVVGMQNMGIEDLVIPRIALLQGLSKACEEFDDARPGVFWHTIMDTPIGKEFEFIVVRDTRRYLLSVPLGGQPEGVLARSDDGINWTPSEGEFEVRLKGVKDPVVWKLAPTVRESYLDQFGTQNPEDPSSPPAATLFYTYLIVLPEHLDLGPCTLDLSKTAIKVAKKQLNSKISIHAAAGRSMHALKFRAKPVKENGPGGDYYNWSFTGAGFATEEEYALVKSTFDRIGAFRPSEERGGGDGEAAPTSDKF